MVMEFRVDPTGEYRTCKTVVWWDMDSARLPIGYEPSRVGPRIDTELKNLGYNGPLTIVAYGDLQAIPLHVLRALNSGGIVLKHVPNREKPHMLYKFEKWLDQNTPVTLLVISDGYVLEDIASKLCNRARDSYKFLLAYPPNAGLLDPIPPSVSLCGEWCWDAVFGLLKGSGAEETTRLARGSELFSCQACDRLSYGFNCSSFEDFIKHLDSAKHAHKIACLNRDWERHYLTIAQYASKERKTPYMPPKRQFKKKKLRLSLTKFHILPKKRKSKAKKLHKIKGEHSSDPLL